jgi:membrane protein implicated in regulation of membrane protease activity
MLVAWLVLGVVLLAIELSHFGFFALFGAVGAFAAAITAAIWPSAIPLQVAVFIVAAGIGIIAFRPMMSAAFHRRHEFKPGRGVHGSIVGEEVLTLDVVSDSQHAGHVRLAGERWLAVSGSGQPIPAGTPVIVMAVLGTTLEVWPTAGATGYVDTGALGAPEPAPEEGDPR